MDGFLVMQGISLDTPVVAMVLLVGQMLFFSCMVITFERNFFIKV